MPAVLGAIGALALALTGGATAAGGFQLGLWEPAATGAGDASSLLFSRIQGAGARIVRADADWRAMAPDGFTRPPGFHPRNAADPQYRWTGLDAIVRSAGAHGLVAMITLDDAPVWAVGSLADRAQGNHDWGGAYKPNAADLGDFAFAVATRYGGHFPDPMRAGQALPRARYIQAWNEPNYRGYLYPQGEIIHGRPVNTSAPRYVAMLNAVYDNVKRAVPSDLVISAGFGPFGIFDRVTSHSPVEDSDPQYFMRAMYCLTGRGPDLRALRGCHLRPRFDIFDQHPYTLAGTPTSKGFSIDDGAMGNLPDIKHTVDVAVRLGHAYPARPKRFWVTEFDWWSNPPDTSTMVAPGSGGIGKPLPVQARYLSESAYLMWRSGVDTLLWYLLRDDPGWPGGLYLAGSSPQGDRPKPALQAFELPFYAFRSGGRLVVWALSPGGTLQIQRTNGSGWRRVTDLRPSPGNVVYARLGKQPGGTFRAVALSGPKRGLASYPFPAR